MSPGVTKQGSSSRSALWQTGCVINATGAVEEVIEIKLCPHELFRSDLRGIAEIGEADVVAHSLAGHTSRDDHERTSSVKRRPLPASLALVYTFFELLVPSQRQLACWPAVSASSPLPEALDKDGPISA